MGHEIWSAVAVPLRKSSTMDLRNTSDDSDREGSDGFGLFSSRAARARGKDVWSILPSVDFFQQEALQRENTWLFIRIATSLVVA